MEKCNWKAKSGRGYSFDVYQINTQFNDVNCVYIYTKIVNGEWRCIYVGQTSQLKARLAQHINSSSESDKCIQRSGATHIHVLVVNTEKDRLSIETDLRNSYSWSCNMQ